MSYPVGSIEQRLLENDSGSVGTVIRWIAAALTSPRFWPLREEWADLHQEVLTRVIESLRRERFDASRDFRVYVQGIARFTALQALSRRFEDRARANPVPEEADPPVAEAAVLRRQLVRRVLDLASEECRNLFHAYFLEDQGYAEIAAAQNLPLGTIKSRLFRCLESAHLILAGRLSRRSGKPSA